MQSEAGRRAAGVTAFSGEVEAGSPQKMRAPKERPSEFRCNLNGIRSKPKGMTK
jgi:hypothetical protein